MRLDLLFNGLPNGLVGRYRNERRLSDDASGLYGEALLDAALQMIIDYLLGDLHALNRGYSYTVRTESPGQLHIQVVLLIYVWPQDNHELFNH